MKINLNKNINLIIITIMAICLIEAPFKAFCQENDLSDTDELEEVTYSSDYILSQHESYLNLADIYQAGYGNNVLSSQNGSVNFLSVSQNGYDNTINMTQNGERNISTISQSGADNFVDAVQNNGFNLLIVNQMGNGNSLICNQNGSEIIGVSQAGGATAIISTAK